MQLAKFFFSEDIYSQHLKLISGVKFTPREIDVLSCFIAAWGASKTASFLNISPNTVFSHVRNIMAKVGRNSREGIIDFLEQARKIHFLREYHAILVSESLFCRLLQDCLKLNPKILLSDLVILCGDSLLKNALMKHLGNQLNRAGFETKLIDGDKDKNVVKGENQNCIIFVSEIYGSLTETNFLDLGKEKDYYIASLRIIQKLFSEVNLEHLFKNFSEIYNSLKTSITNVPTSNEEKPRKLPRYPMPPKNWGIIIAAFSAGILLVVSQVIKENKKMQELSSQGDVTERPIRSDMIIPTESGLFQRPEEIAKIDSILKKQSKIQSIAIVGPGGAGKTVLARQYAHQQKASVIWEINAETPESLNASFESLAHALATIESESKRLKEIRDIKNSSEREVEIIQFVKDQLKSHSNWFLIYDNVEKFTDIQKHFPNDSATWGTGRVILTTRDKNIHNNNYVNSFMQIKELENEQKLNLFLKIMVDEEEELFPKAKKEEVRQFLENIPPYPLDVSIAAYYLKSTRVPYVKYLENLFRNDKDFTRVQKNILNEAGDYAKTRYEIITLSLRNLINTDKAFEELLLFISLLGSQDIPRELLAKYKSDAAVDDFIYNLKKYSLITKESSLPSLGQAFSLHRSTREIILAYLVSTLKIDKLDVQLRNICSTLNEYAKLKIDEEDLSTIGEIIGHYDAVLSHTNLLSDTLRSSVGIKLGSMYHCLRFYTKAQQLLENSLLLLEKHPTENNKQIIETLAYLTTIYMELGDHDEARNILEKRLSPYKQYLSSINPEIAWTLVFFGDVSGILGNYAQATKLLEQSYKLYKEHHSTDHLWIARILSLLGNNYSQRGSYEKAKVHVEDGLKIHKKKLVKNHLEHAWTLTYLGNIYGKLGEHEEAKNSLEEALGIAKLYLPENHLDLAWASVYLAHEEECLGNLTEAKLLLEKSLSAHKNAVGEENIRSAWVLWHLGKVDTRLGHYEEAKTSLEKALQAYEQDYGGEHIETSRVLIDLGYLQRVTHHFGEAEQSLQRAFKILQASDHTDQYMALEEISELYLEKAAKDKENAKIYKKRAEELLKKALEIVRGRFSENSPHAKRLNLKLKNMSF